MFKIGRQNLWAPRVLTSVVLAYYSITRQSSFLQNVHCTRTVSMRKTRARKITPGCTSNELYPVMPFRRITKLCQTINWQIRNLYRIRRYIDQETCANIVRAMLLSRLDYCNVLFNNIAQRDLDRLQRLQNKCARLVFMPPRRANISPLLKKLHWLRIKDRISFKTLLYVYKSLNGLCPRYIDACLIVKNAKARLRHALTTVSTSGFLEATNVPVTEPFQWLLP